MKKLLLFLVGLGVLALWVEADFYAYFSDVDTVPANSFQVGIVDVELGDPVWISAPEPDLNPGETVALLVPVRNMGTLPFTLDLSIEAKGELAEAVREHIEISPSSSYLEAGAYIDVQISALVPKDIEHYYEGQGGTLFLTAKAMNEKFFDEERTPGYSFAARTEPPHVDIISPVEGGQIKDSVAIQIHAVDNFAVDHILFFLDGRQIGKLTSPPYTLTWNAGRFSVGKHALQVEVFDGADNKASDTIWVKVHGDGLEE